MISRLNIFGLISFLFFILSFYSLLQDISKNNKNTGQDSWKSGYFTECENFTPPLRLHIQRNCRFSSCPVFCSLAHAEPGGTLVPALRDPVPERVNESG